MGAQGQKTVICDLQDDSYDQVVVDRTILSLIQLYGYVSLRWRFGMGGRGALRTEWGQIANPGG